MLKTIVNQGVKLGFKGLVDPKSLTIDVPPLMIGALIDTNAIGVVKAEIRGAKNLNSVTGGKSIFFLLKYIYKHVLKHFLCISNRCSRLVRYIFIE